MSACAVVDPVHQRSENIDRSLGEARNKTILLNIIRASHQWPLNFTTIAQVSPSMTNGTTLALPQFLLGPNPAFSPGRDVIFGDTSLSNSLMVSSNFSVTSLNTGSFYNGLLNPVSLHDLNYFIRQNYSRELLFWLFTDTVELKRGPSMIGFHYDPPKDYGCAREDSKRRCFHEWAEIAAVTGLTAEDRTVRAKSADGKTAAKIYSRLCFDSVLAQEAQNAMNPARLHILQSYLDVGLKKSPRCNEPWNPGARGEEENDTLIFHLGPFEFKILPRSTNSIYKFLGQLLQQQRDHIPPAASAYLPRLEEAGPPILSTEPNNPELLTIVPDQPGMQCFVHTYFFDGDYCVPEYGGANTKRIFSILAELLALKTTANELAITPLVRVVP